jgi:hypothetical protein
MTKAILILVAFISVSGAFMKDFQLPTGNQSPQQVTARVQPSPEPAAKVTIQTAADSLGAQTARFNVGDQILVPITITNTSNDFLNVCLSADLYQNLPKLTKDGQPVAIMRWQLEARQRAQLDRTCKELNVPDIALLQPKASKLLDWLVLVDSGVPSGAETWYDSLPPGKYELSLQRRINCCDGPMIESNKVSFEIVAAP